MAMKPDEKERAGEAVTPCTEAPALRYRDPSADTSGPTKGSEGYTSPGHVAHFLPDREVNLGRLNKALVDVFGEPALRGTSMELEIDKEYWLQVCSDPWSGNVYRYNFGRLARLDESIINPAFLGKPGK
ncbi:MAG TPA: hypothetical protein VFX80_04460 [Solirubrobacteraceae bacterium]|nr:hypothetical protein [Solirubrobacteraceae bacterium]